MDRVYYASIIASMEGAGRVWREMWEMRNDWAIFPLNYAILPKNKLPTAIVV